MSAHGGHRTLLAAYPARLRRKHGGELVATLMEATGGRPTRSERGWLVLDGLRERFRPPARRPLAVVAAVLAMLVGGALGAALGSWAGTAGYPALPDAAALSQRILPGLEQSGSSDRYLFASAPVAAGTGIEQAAQRIHQKLAADGWRTGPVTAGDASPGLTDVHFAAENAETRLDVYVYRYADGTEGIQLAGWPQRPASYLPLTIAGTLLGLAAGWLAGVALAHRIRAARRPRRSTVLATVGLVAVLPSAAGFVASLVRYLTVADPVGTGELVHSRGFAFAPTVDLMRALDLGEGWFLSPSDLEQLPIWGFALIAVAAIIARPRRGDLAGEPGNRENSRVVA
ncbi:hypothetical protein [Pseudosporangium ferrugineum]|uniref:Uncharacterized protein n=1 Tax=Pseudosporangium ferrugineum TaxID=439699 RepID=A0A2T0RS14_9ACTN|nr:hypothetical protein [Pseudosporangium ferrugineum]PRY23974.1 hypothetical protein CLV70_114107 [Pseudosporangium ferrugineum]